MHPVQALDGTLIDPLGVPLLTPDEIDAIVAFLESLTDERVLYRRATPLSGFLEGVFGH